jgi:hypothetical protein
MRKFLFFPRRCGRWFFRKQQGDLLGNCRDRRRSRARGDLPGGPLIAGHVVISRVGENFHCFLVVEKYHLNVHMDYSSC